MSFDAGQLFAFLPDADPGRRWAASCCSPRRSPRARARAGLAVAERRRRASRRSVALVIAVAGRGRAATTYFQGMLVVDRMALFLDGAFIVAALLTLLLSPPPT